MITAPNSPAREEVHLGFIVHFLDEPTAGGSPDDLHLTVLSHILDPQGKGFRALDGLLRSIERAPVIFPGPTENFGDFGEHRALTFDDPSGDLGEIHMELCRSATGLGFVLARPQFAGLNYRPHISLGTGGSFQEAALRERYADGLRVNRFSLLDSRFSAAGRFLGSEIVGAVELRQ